MVLLDLKTDAPSLRSPGGTHMTRFEHGAMGRAIERQDVSFVVGGQHCAAWLYRPSSERPQPVIVMAHGLAGVREMRLDAFAERFCQAGYACLVFDYRHEPRRALVGATRRATRCGRIGQV